MFENLSPGQQQALKYGAPLVAAVAIGVKLAGGKKAADEPAAPTPVTVQTPNTDALGVGQLAEFESSLTEALYGIQQGLDNLVNNPNPTTPTPEPQPGPTPAPTPTTPGHVTPLPAQPTYALTTTNAPPNPPHPTTVNPADIAVQASTPAVPSGQTHTVKAGETLSVIGRYYGIPWQIIAQLNHLGGGTSLRLRAGQVLALPRVA